MSNYSPYDNAADFWKLSRISGDPQYLKQNRPHIFIEKPAMKAKLPNLKGKRVLALGCGSAEEIELLTEKDASEIVGVDISKPLIEQARESYPELQFYVMDAEKLEFKPNTFDFVYSSLVLDYFPTWTYVMENVYRIIKRKGTFLFSTVHPVKWSAKKFNDDDGKAYATLLGFQKSVETGNQEILGDYLNTVFLKETWSKVLQVEFYSRSISAMFSDIVKAGFEVKDIVEPKAIKETKEYDKDYYYVNQRIPNFIIFECKKP